MSRFAPVQPDLFAPPPSKVDVPDPPPPDPLVELRAMLAMLQAAEELPWPTIYAAQQEEYRVMHLGKEAGAEGAKLVSAIFEQTERLLAMTD